MKFFSALGDNYKNFISTFFQTHSLVTVKDSTGNTQQTVVTFETAVLKAIHEEQTQRLMTDQAGIKANLFAGRGGNGNNKNNKRPPSKRSDATCHYCVKANRRVTTHKPKRCFFKHPELRPESWGSNDAKRQKTEGAAANANTANLAVTNNSYNSAALNPTFITLRDNPEGDRATPTHAPSILSRMFSGFKSLQSIGNTGMTNTSPTVPKISPLANIPMDSSTGKALLHLGLLSLPNEKAKDLAKKIAQCIVLDSGCSQTNLCQKSLFTDLRPYKGPPVYGINETIVTPE
jgi:hypothetical protein